MGIRRQITMAMITIAALHAAALLQDGNAPAALPEVVNPSVPAPADLAARTANDALHAAVTSRLRYVNMPNVSRSASRPPVQFTKASWYGAKFHGRLMANGQVYNMHDPTVCAHVTYPMGTRLKVSNAETGDYVIVTIKDRGPYSLSSAQRFHACRQAGGSGCSSLLRRHPTRGVDLSRAAFEKIAPLSRGVIDVVIEVIHDDDLRFLELETVIEQHYRPMSYLPPESPGHLDLMPLF